MSARVVFATVRRNVPCRPRLRIAVTSVRETFSGRILTQPWAVTPDFP